MSDNEELVEHVTEELGETSSDTDQNNSQTVDGMKRPGDLLRDGTGPAKRFCLPSFKDDKTSWELPEELATFFTDWANKHQSEKELEPFMEILTPSN